MRLRAATAGSWVDKPSGGDGSGTPADNSVTTAKILDGAVTTAKLAGDAVTNAKIANNAVDTENINADAITAAKIDDGAVGTDAIANDAVTQAKLADNAVEAATIKDGAISTAKIADGAITGAKMANSTITSGKIAANAVTSTQIANNAVGNNALADNAVTTGKITTGAVNGTKIANNAVDGKHLNAGTATSGQVLTASVSGGVTSLDWTNKSSTTIADGSISTAKLANNAVTNAKMADSAVGLAELNAGTGTANQVLARNSSNNGLDWVNQPTLSVADGSISTAKLAADAVTNAKLADDAVKAENLDATNDGTAGQVPSLAANGQFTWIDKGGSGGSFTAATQADVRAGTNNTKGVTALAMSRFYDEMQRQIRNQWSSWSASIEVSNATLSNVITASELHAATGSDSRSVTLAQGTPSIIPGTLSNLPQGTRFALTWQTGGVRHLMQLNTSGDTFFFTLANNAWVAMAQDPMQFHPLTLPDTGDSYALADTATDHPDTTKKWTISRGRRKLRAWALGYAGGVYTVFRRERSYGFEDVLLWGATAATNSIWGGGRSRSPNSNNSPYPLPGGLTWEDFDSVTCITSFEENRANSSGEAVYTGFPVGLTLRRELLDSSTFRPGLSSPKFEIPLPAGPGNTSPGVFRILSETTWDVFNAGRSNGLVRLWARRQFPL